MKNFILILILSCGLASAQPVITIADTNIYRPKLSVQPCSYDGSTNHYVMIDCLYQIGFLTLTNNATLYPNYLPPDLTKGAIYDFFVYNPSTNAYTLTTYSNSFRTGTGLVQSQTNGVITWYEIRAASTNIFILWRGNF